jgi:hypothetical protein
MDANLELAFHAIMIIHGSNMGRIDISQDLIHFTKDETKEAAFKRLQKIIRERKLFGGTNLIKGKYRCVCFSEAPLTSLAAGLINEDYYSTYSPFGVMVSKQWLFEQGGRPVIYQPNSEFRLLPESHRWRHVTFDIRPAFSFSDFTWEREWRIRCDELPFDHKSARIVVPDARWAARLIREHDDEQDYTVEMYSLVIGSVAELYRERFGWTVARLK